MKKLSKILNESAWGDMMRRGSGEEIRTEDGKVVKQLEIDGVLYKFTNIFWQMSSDFNEEDPDGWDGFGFNKPKDGSHIINGYGKDFGEFCNYWGTDEDKYDIYVIKDFFDRDKFIETLLENGGDLKEFHGPIEITDIILNYTKKILDDNHMSEYAHHRLFDISTSDNNETFGIYAETKKEYVDIPDEENFTVDDITDANVITFPLLGDETNPWSTELEKELIEKYKELGWTQVESYEQDSWGSSPSYEDALMFVKFKEGFVPKEPEYEDDENYRDY